MRPLRLGLAAVILAAFAAFGVVTPAAAASKPATPAPPPITKEARAKGMADAPGLIQTTNLSCTLADAQFIGSNTDPKTKVKTDYYEIACTGAEGFVVAKASNDTVQPFSCIDMAAPGADGKPNPLACVLPGNADPKAGLMPFLAKSPFPCTPTKARGLGHTPKNAYFEVACQEGSGFIVVTSQPPSADKPVQVSPCLTYQPTDPIKCELSDRAAQLAVADRLAAQSGKNCVVKDRAYFGLSKENTTFFEVSCQDGKGYILEEALNGSLMRAVDCVNADGIGGGCKLTDARQAKTEQANLYTQLARKAGFACDVKAYAPFSVNMPGKDVVELTCNNRPDGAVAIFGGPNDPAKIYDCAHSELEAFRCSLTKPDAALPTLTADLRKLGRDSCAVSASRIVGVTADKRGYIEVACADGLQGFMIEYSVDPLEAKVAIVCAEAKGVGGGCALPGNKKS